MGDKVKLSQEKYTSMVQTMVAFLIRNNFEDTIPAAQEEGERMVAEIYELEEEDKDE